MTTEMTNNIYPFPLSEAQLKEKFLEALASGRIEEALNCLEDLLERTPSFELQTMYVELLLSEEKYQQAYRAAEVYRKEYLKTHKGRVFYIRLLLRAGHLTEAQLLLESCLSEAVSTFERAEFKELRGELEQRSISSSIKHRSATKTVPSPTDFLKLPEQEKMTLLKKMPGWSLTEIKQYGQELLHIKDVSWLMRYYILERLVERRDHWHYDFLTVDGVRSVRPDTLTPFQELPLVKQLPSIIEQEMVAPDPVFFNLLEEELTLQLMKTYPLTDELIPDARIWVKQTIMRMNYPGQTVQVTSEIEREQLAEMELLISCLHLLEEDE